MFKKQIIAFLIVGSMLFGQTAYASDIKQVSTPEEVSETNTYEDETQYENETQNSVEESIESFDEKVSDTDKTEDALIDNQDFETIELTEAADSYESVQMDSENNEERVVNFKQGETVTITKNQVGYSTISVSKSGLYEIAVKVNNKSVNSFIDDNMDQLGYGNSDHWEGMDLTYQDYQTTAWLESGRSYDFYIECDYDQVNGVETESAQVSYSLSLLEEGGTYIKNGVQYAYNTTEKQAKVIGPRNGMGSVVSFESAITVNGVSYPVKEICSEAFYGCSYLEEVTIPASVDYIGDYAFRQCVSDWDDEQAVYKNGLKKITFKGKPQLGDMVFAENGVLSQVDMPKGYSLSTDYEKLYDTFIGSIWYDSLLSFDQGEKYIVTDKKYGHSSFVAEKDGIYKISVNAGNQGVRSNIYEKDNGMNEMAFGSSDYWDEESGETHYRNYETTAVLTAGTEYVFTISGIDENTTAEISYSVSLQEEGVFTEKDGIKYLCLKKNKTAIVVGYTEELGEIVNIPENIKINSTTYIVTEIYERAFGWKDVLKEVTIPKTVTKIGELAFYHCSYYDNETGEDVYSLKKVIIKGTPEMENDAFASNAVLKEVVFSDTYDVLGNLDMLYGAFNDSPWTDSLADFLYFEQGEQFTITDRYNGFSKLSVEKDGFYSIEVSAGAKAMGASLHEIDEENGYSEIISKSSYYWDEQNNTYKSQNFTIEAWLQAGVDYELSFWCSEDTTSATVSYKVAFQKAGILLREHGIRYVCDEKKKTAQIIGYTDDVSDVLDIPESIRVKGTSYTVNEIAESAFEYCQTITSIKIPDTVTAIGDFAFQSCGNLEFVTIPSNVKYIGEYAFSSCYYYDGDTGELVNGLKQVSLNGAPELGNGAFCDNILLATVQISDTALKNNYSILENAFIDTPWFESLEEKDGLYTENNQLVYYKNNVRQHVTDIVKVDGNWYNLVDGVVVPNTIAKNANGWWYIDSTGKVDFTYTGMAKSDSLGWIYITNGRWAIQYTDLAKNDYGWWYMKNGKLDQTYTGMYKSAANGWVYLSKGKWDTKYTELAKNDYGWWYMKNGKLDQTYTGMYKSAANGWVYISKGKWDLKYSELAKNDYGYWYMKDGKLNQTYTGMYKSTANGWVYLSKGKWDTKYTDMAKNDYGYWYMKNGKLDQAYTGMYKYAANGWIYVSKGKWDTSYTGMANNSYGWWYMKNGKLDQTYTGMAKNTYGWWYMKNGKLDKTYTGMAKNSYGWWYMKNGKLDTSFTGVAKNQYGSWYMVKGKLASSYNGKITYQSQVYQVKNGKVTKL